jgi:hypothetical protein
MQVTNEVEVLEHRLFLDLSSSCSGYAVARIKKGSSQQLKDATCEIVRAGAIWFPPSWSNDKKYYYMYRLVCEDFYVTSAVTDIIYERYSFNSTQAQGSLVVPEMIGAIKVAAHDNGSLPMGVEDIPPQVWRAQLGLKSIKAPKMKGGKQELSSSGKPRFSHDWKTPTIEYFQKMFGDKVPDQLISNVTGKLRATPNDVFDALGVCVGWHMKLGVRHFKIRDGAFNTQLLDLIED